MSEALDDFLRRREQARIIVEGSEGISPETAVKSVRNARQLNTTPAIGSSISDLQLEVKDALRSAQRSPTLQRWLDRPEKAAIARGDFQNMADVDETVRIPSKPTRLGRLGKLLSTTGESMGAIGAPASALGWVLDAVDKTYQGKEDITPEFVGGRLASGVAGHALGGIAGVGEAALETLGFGENSAPVRHARAQRYGWEKLAKDVRPEATTEGGEAIGAGLESLPLSVGALAGGAYLQSAKAAAVLMGVATGGSSYGQARDEGLSSSRALLYGGIDAAIEAGTEFLPFQKLMANGSPGLAKRFLETIAADIPGEQLATLGQDFNAFVSLPSNESKTFGDFLEERPDAAYKTLVASLIGSGAMATGVEATQFALNKLGRTTGRAANIEETERFASALGQLAAASKVLQRDKGSFEEFVAAAAQDSEVDTVFIEAAQLNEVLSQSGLTVDEVYEATGMMPEELEQMVERGEDIAIPIEKYASSIAPTALNEALMPHIRLDAEDMSRNQAETFLQSAQEEFQRDAEIALTNTAGSHERVASRARVEERILGELNTARRFTGDVNQVYASVVGSFFDTMGERAGVTAEEMADRYGLRVQSGEVAQPTYDQQPELAGLPRNSRGGFSTAQTAAQSYMSAAGLEYNPPRAYTPVDPERASRIAAAYDEMQHAPNDPEVRAAYDALVSETLAQYEVIKATGLEIEFVQGEDPYQGNPWGAVDDVRENNHIYVFRTEDGYGPNGIAPSERARNPMLQVVPGEEWSGQSVMVNDIFRVVHDYFGHIKTGVGFRANGEENAWRAHSTMYSPLARRAMTSETRGQNSWLNFGPFGEQNRNAKIEDTEFAPQKIGLMPEWVSEEGAGDPLVLNQSAAELQTLPMGVQGSGPGGRVLNKDVGEALTLRHRAKYGRALDPTDPGDYAIALQSLLEDYAEQQSQPDNGEAWYSDDIAQALSITAHILPEIEDPVRRDIFLTAVALLSPQQGPVDNWNNAIVAMTGYSIDGRFALQQPDGKEFGVKSHSTGMALFEHLIEQYGEIGALVWLNDEHTGAEMEALRRSSGLFLNKADNYLPKEMNKTEKKLGVYIFGPKVGDFMLNSTGMDQSAVTVDLWMARTYNRVIGRLMDVNEKRAAEGGLADAMRGKSERAIVKNLVRDAAKEAGIAPSAMQAALWYFEQRLYRNHGIKSESTSFSDAAREAALRRGTPVDEPVDLGRATRSAEAPSGDVEEGVRVYNQDAVADPLDAFKGQSLYPTRAVRHADGTIYADVKPFWPERLEQLAEQFGAPAVVAVASNAAELNRGVPLWHTAPPLEADGTIRLDHWGAPGVTTTDPTRWGKSGTLGASERSAISGSLPRTYFGIASGQPGGYIIEFPGRQQYSAYVDPATIYDVKKDPDKLKPAANVAELERKIKAAGYIGYWTQDQQLGLVATVFEPLAVQPAVAHVYAQDAVFFSALERAIERTATQKANAQQWEATLRKTPGIKEEELEWTGLIEFLRMQEGPITRDQVLEIVRGAGIRVDEVVLGIPAGVDAREEDIRRMMGDMGWDRATAEEVWDEDPDQRFEVREAAVLPTEFSFWTTDTSSGTYRELLLTLPVGEGRNPARAPSTHWGTENVIAHARFMDKVDADGKKVLFIEEVQSDWHQEGRDQGYATVASAEEIARARDASIAASEATDAARETLDDYILATVESGNPVTEEQLLEVDRLKAELRAAQLRERELGMAQNAAQRPDGIPNAPFRTEWPALVMKRMIRWAAEHGYERIAWTTGEQQAVRYNLVDATGPLTYRIEEDGRLRVHVANGWRGIREQLQSMGAPAPGGGAYFTPEQAKETFGAAITERMLGQAGATNPSFEGDTDTQGYRTLADVDLQIGGEGMKAFYDRNLVNIANKLIKKHGTKVGVVGILDSREGFSTEDLEYAIAHKERLLAEIAANPDGFDLDGAAEVAKRLEIERERLATARAGVPQPGFDITPELADVAMGGFPLFQRERGPRGQIAFPTDISEAPSVITLLRGADLSTFVHELGHFMFEVTNHMASQAGAPAEVVEMRDTILRYLGVESADEWSRRTPAQRRDGHERVARSFEAYLFEGRAPSVELNGLFSRLRSWMLQVYRSITRLDVQLTDEVRGAFDRMLASDDAIAEAEVDAEMRPVFTDKPEGMSQSDWEEYRQLERDATSDAAATLTARSLRDMRFSGKAVARELKRLQREIAEQRKAVRDEVEAELVEQPIYRAISLFRTGTLDGQEIDGETKLNLEEVRIALQLDDDPIPDALRGMTKTGGLHPAQAAELLGFSSADHLLKDLLFATPLSEAIEAETDSRMRERYGDLNSPEEVEEAARAAVHNEVRGRFTATELAALQNAPGRKRVLNGAAKRIAQSTISRLRIRDIRPAQYEAAERRAAQAAAKAGTAQLDEAVKHKRNQLLQFHLAKEAHSAREESRKARDYLTKFSVKGTRANIDPSFLDQIDQLLERFDLRQVSDKSADRRKELSEWIEKMRSEGFEPAIDPETLSDIGRKPWRELTVEEMRGVLDAVRNIEHLGRLTKKLLLAKDQADLDTAANEMAQSVRDNAYKNVEQAIEAETWWERIKGGAADFFAMHRKVANLVHAFDGNRYGGAFWERYIRPMNERGDWEAVRNREVNERLARLFQALGKEDVARKEFIPELGRSMSLQGRLMVALNMGNAINRQRLEEGNRFDAEQIEAIIAPLQAHHWDFVEAVWAEIDTFWPEIAAKERRVSGVEPGRVEPEPFQVTVDGELRLIRGGYFPIKYDPKRSTKAEAHAEAEVHTMALRGAFTNATTRRGHTKARADRVGRPMLLNFSVIFSHANQVVHDLAWHEYLIDANRLLKHAQVDGAIRDHYGPEVLSWVRKALEDIAAGDLGAQNAFDASVNHIRTGASVAAMGWSLWTSLLQPVGLTQSFARIGVKHVMKGMGNLLSNPLKMNEKVDWVYSVSPFMRERGNTMQREINEIRNRISAKSPVRKYFDKLVPPEVSGLVADSYFVLIGKAQLIADLPTWLGQYEKSLDQGMSEDKAIAVADQAVIDSQGAGQIKDLAGIQRGGPLMKLWTNFYSYFSATMNLMADRSADFRRKGVKDAPYFAIDMMLLTVLPATISSIMYAVLREGLDLGDDDDQEELLKRIAIDNVTYLSGTMIGLRETSAAFAGFSGYQGPAGTRAFADLARLGKQLEQGEVDEPLLRAANSLAGILLHYPATQVDRTARGAMAVAEGDEGPMALLMGPPVGE